MSTAFKFEHIFRASSPSVILASYFDPGALAAQDLVGGLVDRTVVESVDDGVTWKCIWRVTSTQPIPFVARALVSGGRLQFLEQLTWCRNNHSADLVVTPQILGGRIEFTGRYDLELVAPSQVRRRYSGNVSANIALLSGKIERGIVAEFEKSMPAMSASTQSWLDKNDAG